MYEFFMFLLVALGYFATATAAFWAVRLGQLIWRGRVLRQRAAYIKRLENYYDESHELMTKFVLSSAPSPWLTYPDLQNKVMDLYQLDPRKGDQ